MSAKMIAGASLLLSSLILASPSVYAHHSFAMFDATKSVTLTGTVKQVDYANPHVWVYLTVMNNKGEYQYIYNVQPQKRAEFGKGGGYKSKFTDEWTLAEWFVDHATQTYRLFINEKEVTDIAFTKGAGNFDGAEIPDVFESLSFGWNNYQNAGKGFVAWIDDIALAKDRIGNRGVPVPKTKKP